MVLSAEASAVRRPSPGEDGRHITYCRLCEAQCGLIAEVADGKVVKIGPDRDHPVSQGHLCVKGPAIRHATYDPERVLTPLKRVGGPGEFAPCGWDEALDDIAARLTATKAAFGDDSLDIYLGNPGSFATLHYGYALGFFAAIGGQKVFSSFHVDTGAKSLACQFLYGNPLLYTFPDLDDCDMLLMLGANPMVSHMSLTCEPRALAKLEAIAERGGVVVVDPRRTETAQRFEHVAIRPDTDAWLLAGMLRVMREEGLLVHHRIDDRIVGWPSLIAALAPLSPAAAAARCGIAEDTLRTLARRFSSARTAACYGRVGTNRGRFATLTNVLIETMNLVTGRFGVSGGWVFGRTPFAAGSLDGLQSPYGERRSRIGNLPVIAGTTPSGTLAAEITTPGEGQLKALIVDSGNPVHAYPGSDGTAAAMEQLDLLVAIDLYVTETTRHAHYILPAQTFLERGDCNDLWSHNAPRPWLHYSPPVIAPLGEARHEQEIYNGLSERMGLADPFAGLIQPGDVRPSYLAAADTLLRMGPWGDQLGANPAGLSLDRLERDFPSGHRHIDRVEAGRSWDLVGHRDGIVGLWNDVIAAEVERMLADAAPADPDVLLLFGRRKLRSMNSWMHNSEAIVRNDAPTLLIHPADAQRRGIEDGETVVVATRGGQADMIAEITTAVMEGSVNYPHGWGHHGGWSHANALGGANVNRLASADPADWEQVSGMCRIDGFPVTVSRSGPARP